MPIKVIIGRVPRGSAENNRWGCTNCSPVFRVDGGGYYGKEAVIKYSSDHGLCVDCLWVLPTLKFSIIGGIKRIMIPEYLPEEVKDAVLRFVLYAVDEMEK